MKVYIAALYARRFELREVDQALRDAGHEPTSQWVWNAEESKGQREAAEMDVADVRRADAVLFFGQPPRSMNSGGGRWFELGLAWAEGKHILAVLSGGGTETIFLHLPSILLFERVEDAIEAINAIDAAPPDRSLRPEVAALDFQYDDDPVRVQAKVLKDRHGCYMFQLSAMEQEIVMEAREAGRATVGWDTNTVTGRLGAFWGVKGLKQVRQL